MTHDLEQLLKKSVAIYDGMSPLEKAIMHYEQRRSWVRGELMLEYGDMTMDEANALIDKVEARTEIVKP